MTWRAISARPYLKVLKLTHNAITSLNALGLGSGSGAGDGGDAGSTGTRGADAGAGVDDNTASALEELWIQNNKLADVAELAHLATGCPGLRRLVLKPNPCTRKMEPEVYRETVAAMLTSLRSLDGVEITAGPGRSFQRASVPVHLCTSVDDEQTVRLS